MDLLTEIAVLVLGAFVGFEVISKIPNTLHTPLMSATNAIHGIVLLGGLLVIAEASGFFSKFILVVAIAFGTINVIGGFLVTDRMLGMFSKKPKPKPEPEAKSDTEAESDAEPEAEPEPEPDTEAKADAESDTESKPETDAKSDAEAEPKAKKD